MAEGTSREAAWWSEPDELGFRAIEPQSIRGHPRLNTIEAAGESSFEDWDIGNWAVVVDLEVIGVTVNPKATVCYEHEDIRGVEDIIQWAKDRSLWHTACDWRDSRFQPVVSHVLWSAGEVESDPFERHLNYSVRNPQSTSQNVMVHTVKSGT